MAPPDEDLCRPFPSALFKTPILSDTFAPLKYANGLAVSQGLLSGISALFPSETIADFSTNS